MINIQNELSNTLVSLNDLDPYHREKELKSHSIKKPELDSYYNNLSSENEVSKVL